MAKHRHKFSRSTLKVVTAQLLRDSQAGAIPHQSTDFVTHTTLTVIRHMKHLGRPLLLLFLDLKDAFYRMAPRFIYRHPTAPGELLHLMQTIAIPGAILPALQAALEGAPIFDNRVDDGPLSHR